jgi:pre-mRNA-splicing helicase BRR2
MIYSWRPEIEAVQGASHQPDLSAEEALHALVCLSKLMTRFDHGSFRAVVNVFSFIVRLGRIRIRRHEDTLLRSIHDRVPFKHEPADYDSPYFKIFLLLQAHFYRLPLSPELAADLTIVLERVFSLFSVCAHQNWSNFDSDLAVRTSEMIDLMHMCVHGMWDDDPELKQIPHFDDDVSGSIKRQGLRPIHASGYRPF